MAKNITLKVLQQQLREIEESQRVLAELLMKQTNLIARLQAELRTIKAE